LVPTTGAERLLRVYYKVFNSEGVISTFINKGDRNQVVLMICPA
jgi:hypothetical protein